MNRCYVCRHPGPTVLIRGRGVCQSCKVALPRILQLEAAESILVRALINVQNDTKDAKVKNEATNALSQVRSSYTVDVEAFIALAQRVSEVLAPARAKGHALELVETPDGHLPRFACIMPHCEVCAIVGTADELLRLLVGRKLQ